MKVVVVIGSITHILTTPIERFDFFLTNEIVCLILTETDWYAQQKVESSQISHKSSLKAWEMITHEEMQKLLGLMICMGIFPLPELDIYCSKKKNCRFTFASSIMSRERFRLL